MSGADALREALAAGRTLVEALGAEALGRLLVVDLGAGDYAGGAPPPYAPLLVSPAVRVLGFDALAPEACAEEEPAGPARRRVLPLAIADGAEHIFRTCNYPMTSSLLEPNRAWMARFENLAEYCEVVSRMPLQTMRLDDVAEAAGADFVKIDVQGATGLVLAGASRVLAEALVVQTEVDFGPLYERAMPFGAVFDALGRREFEFHHFAEISTRRMRGADGAVFGRAAVRQLWGDAVFVPSAARLARLPAQLLLRLATIMHDCYGAEDLARAALLNADPALAAAYEAALGDG